MQALKFIKFNNNINILCNLKQVNYMTKTIFDAQTKKILFCGFAKSNHQMNHTIDILRRHNSFKIEFW